MPLCNNIAFSTSIRRQLTTAFTPCYLYDSQYTSILRQAYNLSTCKQTDVDTAHCCWASYSCIYTVGHKNDTTYFCL